MASSFSTGHTMLIRTLSSRAMGRLRPAVVAWPCTSSVMMLHHSSLNRVRTLPIIGVSKRFASTHSDTNTNINVKSTIDSNTSSSSSPSSLASIPSCPKLFAQSLNMTLSQVEQIKQARQSASIAHGEQIRLVENEYKHMLSPRERGIRKHQMICEHRYKHMRHPFVCRKCWTFEPICVCSLFDEKSNDSLEVSTSASMDSGNDDTKREQTKAPLPNGVEHLIIWTHHDEWGRTSNTGSLLPLGLESTTMLMKGLVEHESIMNDILNREDVTPAVLWPGKRGNVTVDNTTSTISASELRARLDDINNCNSSSDNNQYSNDSKSNSNSNSNIKKNGIVLISIEGTWNSARKMVNKLPPNTLRLNVGTEVIANFTSTKNKGIFHNHHTNNSTIDKLNNGNNGRVINPSLRPSLLAPLRRQGEGGSVENVSTLEATLIALLALGLDVEDGGRILSIARTKIDRLTEYVGKVKREREIKD